MLLAVVHVPVMVVILADVPLKTVAEMVPVLG
jgi:hypothetical protein